MQKFCVASQLLDESPQSDHSSTCLSGVRTVSSCSPIETFPVTRIRRVLFYWSLGSSRPCCFAEAVVTSPRREAPTLGNGCSGTVSVVSSIHIGICTPIPNRSMMPTRRRAMSIEAGVVWRTRFLHDRSSQKKTCRDR